MKKLLCLISDEKQNAVHVLIAIVTKLSTSDVQYTMKQQSSLTNMKQPEVAFKMNNVVPHVIVLALSTQSLGIMAGVRLCGIDMNSTIQPGLLLSYVFCGFCYWQSYLNYVHATWPVPKQKACLKQMHDTVTCMCKQNDPGVLRERILRVLKDACSQICFCYFTYFRISAVI